jgi:acetolactate synthase-1/2/3 large subunit
MWAVQFFKFIKPRTCLTSGGLGRWATGPRSHRRQGGVSESLVVDSPETASIQMNLQELATAVQYNCSVKVITSTTASRHGQAVSGALL